MKIFDQKLKILNIGLKSFYESSAAQKVDALHVDWRPSLGDFTAHGALRSGRPATAGQSAGHACACAPANPKRVKAVQDALKMVSKRCAAANRKALEIILSGQPQLVGIDIARELIPAFKNSDGTDRKILLHAGPPIGWPRMCGPMRGAIIGACIYEGWARTPRQAENLAASGKITFSPCHHHHAVGPMAGIVSPSMPMWIIENKKFGNRAFGTMNEGLGKVLRYGAYSPEVIMRLRWMERSLYPIIKTALAAAGPLNLKTIIGQALHMGDECHNRNKAATSLLLRALGSCWSYAHASPEQIREAIRFVDGNDHFFLNISMATAKSILEPAEGIPNCTIVTTMARNGTDFGIRVSGLPGRWFMAPSTVPVGLFFPGFTEKDANPDIGDSSITETAGIGGFSMAAAPAIVQFVGGKAPQAFAYTREMYEITAGENPAWSIPTLDFRGAPTGIDLVKIVSKCKLPIINTGVAHKKPGIGQVGAGVLRAPMKSFEDALLALAKK